MTICWGIVSSGKIAHDFVNAFNSFPEKGDMVVAGVAARDKSRANEFAKVHNIPHVFNTYKDLAESDVIDVAYIGVLNRDHYDVAKLFLTNGKHVLCEKPLCMNYKQAKSLLDYAKEKKLFFMEAVWSRFCPAYLALEKEILAGKIGEPVLVEANFGVSIASVDRLSKKALGGSTLLDLGIYVIQFAQYIFKEEPQKIIAVGELNEEGVDEADTIILDYGRGRRAVLNITCKVNLWNKGTVTGDKGKVTIEAPFHIPTDFYDVNNEKHVYPFHTSPLPYNFSNSAGLVYEAIETARCIREGLLESPRMSHKESLILAKIETEVRRQVGVHYEEDDQEY